MLTVNMESSFTPSNLNKKTAAGFSALDRKFGQTPKEFKKELFVNELKIDYFDEPIDCEIKISEIHAPLGFTRHNLSYSPEELKILDNSSRIKVAQAEGVKGFFMISGQLRLEFHKHNKEKKIKAIIVGQVVCRSQIAMARALEMTRFKRPPNTLQLVQGLLCLYEIIINDFGKEAFFTHGGSRKGKNKKDQLCLSQYIADILGLPKSTVSLLLNFGHHIGPYGLAGLYYHEDMQKLTIRTINQFNGRLKKENLSKKLHEMFHSLHSAKSSEAERIKACGNLAHQIISGHIAALEEGHLENEAGEEFESFELDPSNYDLPPKRTKNPQGSKVDGKNANNNSGGNTAEKDDEETNFEDEIEEALKFIKLFKYLMRSFEKELRGANQLEKTIQNNLGKNLTRFNVDAENMISFIRRIIADLKLGN